MNSPVFVRSIVSAIKDYGTRKDRLWITLWLGGVLILWIWNLAFLNSPALHQVETGFLHTVCIAAMVIVLAAGMGWGLTLLDDFFGRRAPGLQYLLTFIINLFRSVPQIVGTLIGYVLLTILIQRGAIRSEPVILICMAFIIAVFLFLEIFDLLRERISHFRRLDFYDAMLVCGISEQYIINREIILRSSPMHIINKLIGIFGGAIFLLCSVDFIVSVGLSTEISPVDLPVTLGSLLAKIDSKQDILAIGHTLTHWQYFPKLAFEHLQGITVAGLIVFTLLCIYQIADGYGRRYRL
jgi:ABC-type dipeptide/oligopeptide/nickel transport system permease subunit